MKKLVLLVLAVVLVATLIGSTVLAMNGGHGCMWDSGYGFGQHHAHHAQEGHLGMDHNPGHHRGYSPCVP